MKRFLMLAALVGGLGFVGPSGTAEANGFHHGHRHGGYYRGPFIGGGYYGGAFAPYRGLYRPYYVGTPGIGFGTGYVAPGYGYGYGYSGYGCYGW